MWILKLVKGLIIKFHKFAKQSLQENMEFVGLSKAKETQMGHEEQEKERLPEMRSQMASYGMMMFGYGDLGECRWNQFPIDEKIYRLEI